MFQDPIEPDETELRAQFEALLAGGTGDRKRGGQSASPDRAEKALDEAPEGTVIGTISGIAGADVFVDLGVRRQGVLPKSEFDDPPVVGERVEVSVIDDSAELWILSRKEARRAESWRSLAPGKWVKATFTSSNKGGLAAKVGPLDAFVPYSQIDVVRVEDAQSFVGQSATCEVVQADVERGRIVLSRRKVLEAEREVARQQTMAEIREGTVRHGKVTRVESYGAFVEIGPGVEGLVHVSNIGHRRLRSAAEVLKVGQEIEVVVLALDPDTQRIGLGMKQLGPQPWEDAAERYPAGRILEGIVTRLMDFGAFVEIEPGLEGLAHISELSVERIQRPADAVQEGQRVRVRVLSIDSSAKRMSLSRKSTQGALLAEAEDAQEEDWRVDEGPNPERGTNLGDVLRRAIQDPRPPSSEA